jgi:hypothetical protein
MSEKKSLVEEALLQMKNLEQVVTENAKGILASTMKEEIEELVKESLEEADTYAENESYSNEDVTEDEEEDSLMAMDMKTPMMGDDMMSDDSDSMKMDDMDDMDDMGLEDDDDELEPLDMTGASMEEIMAVLNGMGDNDGVIIKKTGEDLDVDKITFQDDDMMESLEESDYYNSNDTNESYDEEIVYEIELGEDDNVDEDDSTVTESSMMVKPKGMGMGKAKSELPTGKVNMKGFKEDMSQHKESFKGPKKFEFKEGEHDVEEKETETKEAARTYGNGSRNFPKRKGLPKMKVITNDALQEEVEKLRAKNEEYRKALNIFREKLNEVAVFNSNLAYATRLFTEHTTTKSEKINIMRRFDNVETIKESKNLYQTIKEELGSVEKPMVKESIVENIDRTPSKGSTNLVESKTYENPQFLRMKDLMSKMNK